MSPNQLQLQLNCAGAHQEVAAHPSRSEMLVQGDRRATKGYRVQDRVCEPLYVIVPIFNAYRWKARWKHAARTIKHFAESGAVVYIVEAAFGEREHAMDEVAAHKVEGHCPPIMDELAPNCRHDDPQRGQHRYIPLRTSTEAWLKENLINLGVSFLPQDWKYVAWIDADVLFSRPNWVGETIHLLQHYDLIQMFSQAQDLDSNYTAITRGSWTGMRPGFAWAHQEGIPLRDHDAYTYPKTRGLGAWSGLAWACRRSAWDHLGGLPDYCIHGGADYHVAFALIGQLEKSIRKDIHPAYRKKLEIWQARAERFIRRNVGCMTGTIQHMWHGAKINRRYSNRHDLLADTQFDPTIDLKYDSHHLLQLVDDGSERFIQLRDGLRRYALQRNEDAIS